MKYNSMGYSTMKLLTLYWNLIQCNLYNSVQWHVTVYSSIVMAIATLLLGTSF